MTSIDTRPALAADEITPRPLATTSLSNLTVDAVHMAHEDDPNPRAHQILLGSWISQVNLFGAGDTDGEQLLTLRRVLHRAAGLVEDRIALLGVVECGAESGYHDDGEPMLCQRDADHDGDHGGHGITWEQGWRAGLTDEPELTAIARQDGQPG